MRVVPLGLLALAACVPSLPLSDTLVVSCANGEACPNGTVCVDGLRCVVDVALDTIGPPMLSPDTDAVVRGSDQTLFVWQGVTGALLYTLNVATDPAMTQSVPGFPLSVDGLSQKVLLPEGTLYWSVSADVTQLAQPAVGRRIGVIGDTVFVRCDAGRNCSAAAGVELGTREVPYASIQRGITGAQVIGVRKAAIAQRQDGSAYNEAIILANGISVDGGFDSSFAASTQRAAIAISTPALVASSITDATVVSNLALSNPTEGGTRSTVVRISDSGAGLEVRNCTIDAPTLVSPAVVIEEGIDTIGPLFEDTTITAQHSGDDEPSLLIGVSMVDAWLHIKGGAINVSVSDNVIEAEGINITRGGLWLENTRVVAGGAAIQDFAVVGSSLDTLTVAGSHLEGVGPNASSGHACALRVDDLRKPSTIDSTDFVVTHAQTQFAVVLQNQGPVRFTNNLVKVADGYDGIGVDLSGAEPAVVTNNTIVVGGFEHSSSAVVIEAMPAVVVNNLILVDPIACGPDAKCVLGVSETPPDGYSAAFFNNVFAGFGAASACANYSNGTCLDSNLNGARAPGGNQVAIGNNSLHTIAELGLSEAFVPPRAGVLAGQGHDPNADDCFATSGVNDPPRASAPSCGPATNDRNGVQRPNPPTIGAYEPL